MDFSKQIYLSIHLLQVYKQVIERLKSAYAQVLLRIGDPLDSETLYAPLHTESSVKEYKETIARALELGGKIEFGGKVTSLIIYVHMCIHVK